MKIDYTFVLGMNKLNLAMKLKMFSHLCGLELRLHQVAGPLQKIAYAVELVLVN